jgi:phosphate/sulfate permease
VSLCGLPIGTTHAAIGKDIGINLYNDLDREYDSIANKLLTHALRGSAAKLDKLTLGNPLCRAVK